MQFLLDLLSCAPLLRVQVVLIVLQTSFWYVCIRLLTRYVLEPWVRRHPMCQQYGELSRRTLASYDVHLNVEQARDVGLLVMAAAIQNVVGGLLSLPAVLGLRGGFVAALARHGALCELAEELQDTLVRIWQITFGGKEGRALNPPLMLVLAGMHHLMGICLIIPMNIYYSENYSYFTMLFMLQGAAGTALAAQQLGFLLDVRTASGLRSMRLLTLGSLCVVVYSRVIAFLHATVEFLTVSRPEAPLFLIAGILAATSMALFNFLIVRDSILRVMKFFSMRIAKEEPELNNVQSEASELEVSELEVSQTLLTQRGEQPSAKVRRGIESDSMLSELE